MGGGRGVEHRQASRRPGDLDAGDGITRDSLAFYRDHRHELGALREVTVRFPAFEDPHDPYLLVLFDVDGHELRLSGCTAGYVGEGPNGTLQILIAEGCPVDAATYVLDGASLRYTRDGAGEWRLREYHSAREHCQQQLDGYERPEPWIGEPLGRAL
jgi:hypothetical protein